MNTRRWIPLTLALACAPAFAGTPIDQTHPLDASARVELRNVAGEVNVTAWDRHQIRITGTLGDGATGLEINGDAQHLTVAVKGEKHSGWFNWGSSDEVGPSTLNVQLPAGVSLKVKTVSASMAISGLRGGSLDLATVSGRVHVQAEGPELAVNSVSGSVDVHGRFERTDLTTVSGDILVPDAGARLKLQTVSGHLQAHGGPLRDASVSTVSGDVELSGSLADEGRIDIESMSGDVRLNLPADLSARIHASSFSGDIRSDIGTVNSEAHGPGTHLDTTAGDGKGAIHVETFSGDLRLRKRSP